MSQQTVLGQFDKMKARINSAALRNGIRWKDRLLDKYWTSWPARWASETESVTSPVAVVTPTAPIDVAQRSSPMHSHGVV